MKEKLDLKPFKIYSITYAGTQLIARYRGDDVCKHLLYDYLHYWQGFETFYSGKNNNNYCVKNGIDEIREATPAEKQALIKKELETNLY